MASNITITGSNNESNFVLESAHASIIDNGKDTSNNSTVVDVSNITRDLNRLKEIVNDPSLSKEMKYQNYLAYAIVMNEEGLVRGSGAGDASGTIVNIDEILETFKTVKYNWDTTHSSKINPNGTSRNPEWKSLLCGSILSTANGKAATDSSNNKFTFYIAGFLDLYHAWLHVFYGPVLDQSYNNLWLSGSKTSFLNSSFVLPCDGIECYWDGIPHPTFDASFLNTHNFFGITDPSGNKKFTYAALVADWDKRQAATDYPPVFKGNNNESANTIAYPKDRLPFKADDLQPNPFVGKRLPYPPVNLNALPEMIVIKNSTDLPKSLWNALKADMTALDIGEGQWSVSPKQATTVNNIKIYDACMVKSPAWTGNDAIFIFMTLNGSESLTKAITVYNTWYSALSTSEKEKVVFNTLNNDVTTKIQYIFE